MARIFPSLSSFRDPLRKVSVFPDTSLTVKLGSAKLSRTCRIRVHLSTEKEMTVGQSFSTEYFFFFFF